MVFFIGGTLCIPIGDDENELWNDLVVVCIPIGDDGNENAKHTPLAPMLLHGSVYLHLYILVYLILWNDFVGVCIPIGDDGNEL